MQCSREMLLCGRTMSAGAVRPIFRLDESTTISASGRSPSSISRQWTSAGGAASAAGACGTALAAEAVGRDDFIASGTERFAAPRALGARRLPSACARARPAVPRLPALGMRQPHQVVDERAPARIGAVAVPLGELGRVSQLEHDRAVAGLDDRGDELVAAVGKSGFRAHPARRHGARRPEDDDGGGIPQPLLDHFVEGLAGMKRRVPPHLEAFFPKAFGERARGGTVLTRIRQEDVSSGHPIPLDGLSERQSHTRAMLCWSPSDQGAAVPATHAPNHR